jgi:hypothetical protein
MTGDNTELENKRAERISFIMFHHHNTLSDIYEKLVDREFDNLERQIRTLMTDLRDIIKSIEDDDF